MTSNHVVGGSVDGLSGASWEGRGENIVGARKEVSRASITRTDQLNHLEKHPVKHLLENPVKHPVKILV